VSIANQLPTVLQAQESNHKCSNNVEQATLQQLCNRFRTDPSILAESYQDGLRNVAGCCHVDFIGQEFAEDAICGQLLSYTNDQGLPDRILVSRRKNKMIDTEK
jgi:hypothetical protein